MIRGARDTPCPPPDADPRRSAAEAAVPAAAPATIGPDLPFEATPADFQKQVQALAVGRRGDDR
jgi:hypothetical protein